MTHLLVTNDFPPKIGGIQSYLWELWRRLPPERFSVLTPRYPSWAEFDARQPFRVERIPDKVLLPTPRLSALVRRRAVERGVGLVVLDPALPVGLLGPGLGLRYALIVHGAEVSVPGRLPVTGALVGGALRGAACVIAGGIWSASEAERAAGRPLPITVVTPGVDCDRFRPLPAEERRRARARLGLPVDGPLVLAVSRLVPRKGIDVLIAACSLLAAAHPEMVLAVAGDGRDRRRLQRMAAAARVPVQLLGRVGDADLPALMASADVFSMLCRNRWAGLEQEGFGIVFQEAAACGVPQVAGDSGGSAEAVSSGETGLVVSRPRDPAAAAAAIGLLLDRPELRGRMAEASRMRAEQHFSYDLLARSLDTALAAAE